MTFLGLHPLDALIIVLDIIGVLVIGKVLSHGVKGEGDFFLGGRSLGKWLQFFPSFGNMTDPGQATTTSSSVYRQGAGGGWLALITLFLTPYFWFSAVWFSRVRLTTMADLFEDRFGKRFLATFYAITTILMSIVSIAGGNVVALKTLQPLMVKDPAIYSVVEKQSVADYHEFGEAARATAGRAPRARVRDALRVAQRRLHPRRVAALRDLPSAGVVLPRVLHPRRDLRDVGRPRRPRRWFDAVQTILVILISVILIRLDS